MPQNKATSVRNADEHSQDHIYYEEIESFIENWVEFEESDNHYVVDS